MIEAERAAPFEKQLVLSDLGEGPPPAAPFELFGLTPEQAELYKFGFEPAHGTLIHFTSFLPSHCRRRGPSFKGSSVWIRSPFPDITLHDLERLAKAHSAVRARKMRPEFIDSVKWAIDLAYAGGRTEVRSQMAILILEAARP